MLPVPGSSGPLGSGSAGAVSAGGPPPGAAPAGAAAVTASGAVSSQGFHLDGSLPASAEAGTEGGDALIGIDDVQKALNRSRASVYRYTNTDPRNLNPPFNPRKLNPEYRSDQKDALLFHPNEVARFARDVLRIKEVTVEVLNSPSTATQQLLTAILEELRGIRQRLDRLDELGSPASGTGSDHSNRFNQQSRPAA